MKTIQDVCRLALVQAEPVLFDKAACIAKALRLIRDGIFIKESRSVRQVFLDGFYNAFQISGPVVAL